ncbi:MAG: hypothetical protein NT142_13305 [Planctomycetota bacterium]|nr:hypothetical protein [Planctomycetota bacterium]
MTNTRITSFRSTSCVPTIMLFPCPGALAQGAGKALKAIVQLLTGVAISVSLDSKSHEAAKAAEL